MAEAPFQPMTRHTHPTDVAEHNHAYTLTTDAPGYRPEDVKVELHDDILTITGSTKSQECKEEEGGIVRRERYSSSSFRRAFRLPENVDSDAITAQLEQGVLRVTIPKITPPPTPAPRTIAVQAGAEAAAKAAAADAGQQPAADAASKPSAA
jgi:HSP20 family protein